MPDLPPGLTPSPPQTWQQLQLGPGDQVPEALGAFIADPTTGTGTLWWLNPANIEDPQYALVDTSRNGSYVVAGGHILNTATQQSFSGSDAALILIDDRGPALFHSEDDCRFWATDLSGDEPAPLATFDLPVERCVPAIARFSPDLTQLLLVLFGSNISGSALYTVDLATGTSEQLATFQHTCVTLDHGASNDEAAVLTAALPGAAWIARYEWASANLTTTSIDTGALAANEDKAPPPPRTPIVSPDGRWVAWSDTDAVGTGFGAGGEAEWPVVVIASIEHATPVVRAHRVALTNGIVTFHWLADSSALVVQSQDGFALLAPDGTLEQLPFPVASHNDPVPIPAPDALTRFLYDGRVVDAAGNELWPVAPVVETWTSGPDPNWWIGNSYAWTSTSLRIVFIHTAVPARDFGRGGIATLGLPAHITTGPAAATPDPIRLRVASDGDNLNVRAAPGLAAEPIGKFPHGTLITLIRDTTIEHCGPLGCSILNDPDLPYGTSWWLYVRDEAGLEGWVTSEFVEWAD
ncbi:MAG: SH3 domain-containing protein [Dehalococcoidia bacterium]|nr:SH3 domain-containing protein [Dehalococcoidia bacterium]